MLRKTFLRIARLSLGQSTHSLVKASHQSAILARSVVRNYADEQPNPHKGKAAKYAAMGKNSDGPTKEELRQKLGLGPQEQRSLAQQLKQNEEQLQQIEKQIEDMAKDFLKTDELKELNQQKKYLILNVILGFLVISMGIFRFRDKSQAVHYEQLVKETQEEMGSEILKLRAELKQERAKNAELTQSLEDLKSKLHLQQPPAAPAPAPAPAPSAATTTTAEKPKKRGMIW